MKTTNLSLAEAHASGRKYRRTGSGVAFFRYPSPTPVWLGDALATDYELEPQAKLLTRDEVWSAVIKANGVNGQQVCNILFGPEDDK